MKRTLLLFLSVIIVSHSYSQETEHVYQFIEGDNNDSTLVIERTFDNGLLINEHINGFKYCNRTGLGDSKRFFTYKDSVLVKKVIQTGSGYRKDSTIYTYSYDSLGRLVHELINSPNSTAIIGQTGFKTEISYYYIEQSDTLKEERVLIPIKNQLIKIREHKYSKNTHLILEHTKKPFYTRTEGESYLYKYENGLLIKEEKRYWNGNLAHSIEYEYDENQKLIKEISYTPSGEKKVIRKYSRT